MERCVVHLADRRRWLSQMLPHRGQRSYSRVEGALITVATKQFRIQYTTRKSNPKAPENRVMRKFD